VKSRLYAHYHAALLKQHYAPGPSVALSHRGSYLKNKGTGKTQNYCACILGWLVRQFHMKKVEVKVITPQKPQKMMPISVVT